MPLSWGWEPGRSLHIPNDARTAPLSLVIGSVRLLWPNNAVKAKSERRQKNEASDQVESFL